MCNISSRLVVGSEVIIVQGIVEFGRRFTFGFSLSLALDVTSDAVS